MDPHGRWRQVWLAFPILVALAAAIPCLFFTYLWDDYVFLSNAQSLLPSDLLPSASDPFYRPLSRGIYFSVLDLAGPAGPFLGHALNGCTLAAVVLLLVLLVRRLAGTRAAVLSGLLFALLAPTPFLVGWISGIQDLLGIAFLLGALHLQLSGRTGAALVSTGMSILSKETAVVLVPVVATVDWILGRRPHRLAGRLAAYGALVAAWVLVHPGMKLLLAQGLRSGATGYVGAEHPERWLPYLGRYVLAMLNVPTSTIAFPWLVERGSVLVAVGVGTVAGFRALTRASGNGRAEEPAPHPRLAAFAASTALLPLLLVSTMVGVWAPYYAVYPALGSSILLGVALARAPMRWADIVLALFLVMGFACRGGKFTPDTPTEYSLSLTSSALGPVERAFKALHPTLPAGTHILVTVQAGGPSSIYSHLYRYQALRVWYREPTLLTMRPDWRAAGSGQDLLFWVSPKREVFEIDTRSLAPLTIGPQPDYGDYQKTLRYYARGLAATGQTERGLEILLSMREPDLGAAALDRRLAAMLLFQEGRERDAQELLRHVPPIYRSNALDLVASLLASPGGSHSWDDAAFRAFGLAPSDAAAWRELMRRSNSPLHAADAMRFARRLLQLLPGDREADAVIRTMSRYGEIAAGAVPAPRD